MTGENIVSLLAGAIVLCAVAFLFGAPPVHAGECQNMVASWYGTESGNRTANGERFDGSSYTAGHRWHCGNHPIVPGIPSTAPVSHLLDMCGPPAVCRLIVAVVVDAIDGVSR